LNTNVIDDVVLFKEIGHINTIQDDIMS